MGESMQALLEIMARLRDPEEGCPWDLEQTFETIAPYTIEEAYEVDHAIRQGDMNELRDELGDLLLQVVYHSRMASEAGHFDFDDVAEAICAKLVRRHPHVFGEADAPSRAAPSRASRREEWERIKRAERDQRAGGRELDPFEGIPIALPALARASKALHRTEKTGPDGTRELGPHEAEKLVAREALSALGADAASPDSRTIARLLFALTDVAREAGVDAERALADWVEARMDRVRAKAPQG